MSQMPFAAEDPGTSLKGYTRAVCRRAIGFRRVTKDLTRVTCKNCAWKLLDLIDLYQRRVS